MDYNGAHLCSHGSKNCIASCFPTLLQIIFDIKTQLGFKRRHFFKIRFIHNSSSKNCKMTHEDHMLLTADK